MVTNTHTTLRFFIALIVLATGPGLSLALAETGTDFPGKVLKVDLEKGKLTVKKEKTVNYVMTGGR